MAQNITLLGASYTDVPAVTLPKTGGGTARFDDVSVTTATASDVANGKVFLASDGTITTGTSSGGGGGSSAWTKVAETTVTTSTTSTSASTVTTWVTGHSELWTSDKLVYVRVRDTAGKRTGYFYGSDQFIVNFSPVNGTTASTTTTAGRFVHRYSVNSEFRTYSAGSTTGYGVYVDTLYSDGRLRIRQRYGDNYSLTIDGTYKVEVYLLDPPTGAPIFE